MAKLDTMVTVVDAVNFIKDYGEAKYLQEIGESLGEDDERSVADLLVDQVEFADIILVSKIDLIKDSDYNELKAIIRKLNSSAKIIPISNGKVSTNEILNTISLIFKTQQAPDGLKSLECEHVPETEEYGIIALSLRLEGLFILKSFMIFCIVKIFRENSYDPKVIFGWQPDQSMQEAGAKQAVLHIMALQVCFGKLSLKMAGQKSKSQLIILWKNGLSHLVICVRS